MKVTKTNRGFRLIEFNDRYKQSCSIQDSSLATESAIWLGVSNTGPNMEGPNGKVSEDINARMHLTMEMVEALIPVLQRFVKTGSIGEES